MSTIRIKIKYGKHIYQDIDGITDELRSRALEAGEAAMMKLANEKGHEIKIRRWRDNSPMRIDVMGEDVDSVTEREDYREAWEDATGDIIQEG